MLRRKLESLLTVAELKATYDETISIFNTVELLLLVFATVTFLVVNPVLYVLTDGGVLAVSIISFIAAAGFVLAQVSRAHATRDGENS